MSDTEPGLNGRERLGILLSIRLEAGPESLPLLRLFDVAFLPVVVGFVLFGIYSVRYTNKVYNTVRFQSEAIFDFGSPVHSPQLYSLGIVPRN